MGSEGGGWFSYVLTFAIGLVVNSGILWLTVRMLLGEEQRPGFPTCAICVLSLNISMIFAAIMSILPGIMIGIAIGLLSPVLSTILMMGVIFGIMWMIGRRVISAILDLSPAQGQIVLIVYLAMSFFISLGVNLVTGSGRSSEFGDSDFEEIAMAGEYDAGEIEARMRAELRPPEAAETTAFPAEPAPDIFGNLSQPAAAQPSAAPLSATADPGGPFIPPGGTTSTAAPGTRPRADEPAAAESVIPAAADPKNSESAPFIPPGKLTEAAEPSSPAPAPPAPMAPAGTPPTAPAADIAANAPKEAPPENPFRRPTTPVILPAVPTPTPAALAAAKPTVPAMASAGASPIVAVSAAAAAPPATVQAAPAPPAAPAGSAAKGKEIPSFVPPPTLAPKPAATPAIAAAPPAGGPTGAAPAGLPGMPNVVATPTGDLNAVAGAKRIRELAAKLWTDGKHDLSIGNAERALTLYKRHLGDTHPETVAFQQQIDGARATLAAQKGTR